MLTDFVVYLLPEPLFQLYCFYVLIFRGNLYLSYIAFIFKEAPLLQFPGEVLGFNIYTLENPASYFNNLKMIRGPDVLVPLSYYAFRF